MTTVLALAGGAVLLYMFWNLLTLPFARGRRGRKLAKAAVSFVALVIISVGFSSAIESEALEAGFQSAGEKTMAAEAGITDPALWAERRDEFMEKRRAEEAARTAEAAEQKRAEERAQSDAASRLAAEDGFYAVGDQQAAFLDAVERARVASEAAANDLAKGGVRRERREALCSIVEGRRIQNWSGTIDALTTNGDGLGVVTIKVGEGVSFGTFNNALSDIGSGTLIDPSAAIFQKLSSLKEGERVRFSGSLFRNDGPDCFLEKSITMAGAMRSPDFVMRLEEVDVYSAAK